MNAERRPTSRLGGQERLLESITFEQIFLKNECAHCAIVWGKSILGRRISKYKDPEVSVCLECSRFTKVASGWSTVSERE